MTDATRIESLVNVYISSPALAALFGVTPDMVRRYVNDYGMPRIANGKYELGECVQWYINRLRLAAAGGENSDVAQEKLRLIRAQRHRVEIENKKSRSELLDHDAVANVLNELGSIFSTQLDGLGPRMASPLSAIDDPAEIQRMLFDECRGIRASTATAITDLAVTYDHGVDNTAATGEGRGPVG